MKNRLPTFPKRAILDGRWACPHRSSIGAIHAIKFGTIPQHKSLFLLHLVTRRRIPGVFAPTNFQSSVIQCEPLIRGHLEERERSGWVHKRDKLQGITVSHAYN